MGDLVSDGAKVLAVVVADFERSAIGTRSRLGELFKGRRVIERVVDRVRQVRGVGEVAVLVPGEQLARAGELEPQSSDGVPVNMQPLVRRAAGIDARVRTGRAWNLMAWRGGAGQWTFFDEEYHPAAIAGACRQAFGGQGAEHVLVVHSHAAMLDVEITSALVHHHLHKNHEMRVTYTPAAPGLSGMLLRADIVLEMGEKGVLPWQLLGYDPKAPTFDTLIREACMQVDPALSKIPNRFCLDTARSWTTCEGLAGRPFANAAEMCLAAARSVAPGVRELGRVHALPREVQLELGTRRLTNPPGSAPESNRPAAALDGAAWARWLGGQSVGDDLLLTVGGDFDPLLGDGLPEMLRAARAAGVLSICVQTDLACEEIGPLVQAVEEGNVDVLTVSMYGHTRETYAKVAGADLYERVMANLGRLAGPVGARGGVPLVVPRLLKVRDTIPEMEAFFDFWIERCGWAVMEYPTDRAGAVPFAGVLDMAPPKRKACRRIWDRLVIGPDGAARACDQDVCGRLRVGHVEGATIQQMWQALQGLRATHADGRWGEVDPCARCREWHRA
jgi:hypothetical protein